MCQSSVSQLPGAAEHCSACCRCLQTAASRNTDLVRSCTGKWLNCSLHCSQATAAALPVQTAPTVGRGESKPASGPTVAASSSSLLTAVEPSLVDSAALESAACSFRPVVLPTLAPDGHAVPERQQPQSDGCLNGLPAGCGSKMSLDPCNGSNTYTFGGCRPWSIGQQCSVHPPRAVPCPVQKLKHTAQQPGGGRNRSASEHCTATAKQRRTSHSSGTGMNDESGSPGPDLICSSQVHTSQLPAASGPFLVMSDTAQVGRSLPALCVHLKLKPGVWLLTETQVILHSDVVLHRARKAPWRIRSRRPSLGRAASQRICGA
jgi:hypothetical protein